MNKAISDNKSSSNSNSNNVINKDAIKVGIELCMSKAYNLSMFIAHIIYNERSLQEQRLALTRLAKNYNHPKIVYAQHCTSMFKLKLSEGGSSSSNNNNNNNNSSSSSIDRQTKSHDSKMDNSDSQKSSNKIVDRSQSSSSSSSSSSQLLTNIDQSTYHFFHGLSRPLQWHLKDPNEDEDERSMNLSAAIGKGGRGRVSSDTSSDGHAIIAPVELNMFNAGPKHMNLVDHSTVGIGQKTIKDRTKLPIVINNNHNNDILNKDNSNYSSDNPPITVGGKDHPAKQDALRIQQYWALTKFFRATYLLLDTLQCSTTTTSTSSTTTNTTTMPATSSSSPSSSI